MLDQQQSNGVASTPWKGTTRLKFSSHQTTLQNDIKIASFPPRVYTATMNPDPVQRRTLRSNFNRRPAQPKKGGRFSLSPTIIAIVEAQMNKVNKIDLENDVNNKKRAQERSDIEANYLKTKQQLEAAQKEEQFRLERLQQWSKQKQDAEQQLREGSSLLPDRKKTLVFQYKVFSQAYLAEALEFEACVGVVNRLKFAKRNAERLYTEMC
jgi:hypothetical protein